MKKDLKDYLSEHTDLVNQRQAIELRISQLEDDIERDFSDIQVGDLVKHTDGSLVRLGRVVSIKFRRDSTSVNFRYRLRQVKKDLTEGQNLINSGIPVDRSSLVLLTKEG